VRINIDRNQLLNTASRIDSFITAQNMNMAKARTAVNAMLSTGWTGADADAFREEWTNANAEGSTSVAFRDAMQGFAGALRKSADLYHRMQVDMIQQAGALIRFMG